MDPEQAMNIVRHTCSNSFEIADILRVHCYTWWPIHFQSIVTELVVRTTTANHKELVTTIVMVPWIIDTTSDLQIILRFHHMAIDAKSEMIHAIYHQLLVLSETHGDQVQQIEFIARIVTAIKPLWVIDLLGPFGFSAVYINSQFFGYSAGSSATI